MSNVRVKVSVFPEDGGECYACGKEVDEETRIVVEFWEPVPSEELRFEVERYILCGRCGRSVKSVVALLRAAGGCK